MDKGVSYSANCLFIRSKSASETLKFTYIGWVCTMVVSKLSAPLTKLPSDLLALPPGTSDARVLHTWGDMSGRFGDSRPTVLQVIQFRHFPNDRTVRPPRVLYTGHCFSDEGYPSSVLVTDGRVLTVFYDACQGYIAGVFSNLSSPR